MEPVVPTDVCDGAAGEFKLSGRQVETAVMLYLRDVHGIGFDRCRGVKWPVYTGTGDPFITVEVGAK